METYWDITWAIPHLVNSVLTPDFKRWKGQFLSGVSTDLAAGLLEGSCVENEMRKITRSKRPVIYLCANSSFPSAHPGEESGLPTARDQCGSTSVQETFSKHRRSVRRQAPYHLRTFPHRAHHQGRGEVHSLRRLLPGHRPYPVHQSRLQIRILPSV